MLEEHIKIRLIYQDESSDWVDYSWKEHKALLSNPPENVEIHIRDFYSDSPDSNETIIISFKLFELMARRFSLEEAAERKQDKRNLAFDPISDNSPDTVDVEQLFWDKEEKQLLALLLAQLSSIQRKRLIEHYVKHLTYRQIAEKEGVSDMSIRESLQWALRKIKKYF